jgi:hypothetical protein
MQSNVLVAMIAGVLTSGFITIVLGVLLFSGSSTTSADETATQGDAIPAGGSVSILQGDIDCDGLVNPVDALKDLRYDAGLSIDQNEPCPDVGSVLGVGGYERVVVTDSLTGPDTLFKTVACSDGKKAFGGGVRRTSGSLDSDELNWVMLESYPGTNQTSWSVLIQALDTGSRNYEFSAICADVAQ